MVIQCSLSLAVLHYMGQSRSAAMNSLAILWNAVFASVFLGERFTAWDGVVTCCILSGSILSLIFGASGASSLLVYDMQSFNSILFRPIDWIGGSVIFLIAASAYIFIRKSSSQKDKTDGSIRNECMARILLASLASGLTGMVSTGVVKGITGAVSLADPCAVLCYWQFYFLLVSLPISIILQLGFLNSALRLMDALEVVPPYMAGVVVVGLTWGMLFTDDANGMTSLSLGLFLLGVFIAVLGVFLLRFKRMVVPACDREWQKRGWKCCLWRATLLHDGLQLKIPDSQFEAEDIESVDKVNKVETHQVYKEEPESPSIHTLQKKRSLFSVVAESIFAVEVASSDVSSVIDVVGLSDLAHAKIDAPAVRRPRTAATERVVKRLRSAITKMKIDGVISPDTNTKRDGSILQRLKTLREVEKASENVESMRRETMRKNSVLVTPTRNSSVANEIHSTKTPLSTALSSKDLIIQSNIVNDVETTDKVSRVLQSNSKKVTNSLPPIIAKEEIRQFAEEDTPVSTISKEKSKRAKK
jgi:Magnesium transporter NIPA